MVNFRNLFKSNKSRAKDKLAQARLSLTRLNSDSDIEQPQARALLKKEYESFEDELFSTFASLLHIAKSVANLKESHYEFDPWYLSQLDIASNHTFSVFNYLDHVNYETLEKFIIQFYHEPEPSNEPVFDIRDKLKEQKRWRNYATHAPVAQMDGASLS